MTQTASDQELEDLTERARIRDASLHLFAERGIRGVTIRDIATAAGVSAALIRRHFGSKKGLRDICDSYALDVLIGKKQQAIQEGAIANALLLHSADPTVRRLQRYLARTIVDGSQAANAMFDHLVESTTNWLASGRPDQSADLPAYAAVLVAMQLGLLVLYDPLHRLLGQHPTRPAHMRVNLAAMDVYSRSLF